VGWYVHQTRWKPFLPLDEENLEVLFVFVVGGLAVSYTFGIGEVKNLHWYSLAVATLLAVGLYSSTYSISLAEARRHIRLILRAITVGVFLKALIIGVTLTLIFRDTFGFILGITVAQIDPLSTSVLLKNNRLSKRAKTILASWAAFDDPVTVIMSLYAPILVSMMIGQSWKPIAGTFQDGGLTGYASETTINLAFAFVVYILWRLIKRHTTVVNYAVVVLLAAAIYLLLLGAMSIAVYFFWMLGVAILGLFMRPPIQPLLDRIIHWALCMAAVLLGIVLVHGINIWKGLTLGCAAFVAQIIVGRILTRKLSKRDSLHIAFAQQNGITAIILALLFETYYTGTVAVVAPAILTVNILHTITNKAFDIYQEKTTPKQQAAYYLQKIQTHLTKIP
jgi:NhaP-type Na+/H+ or K+/H+ antiporter